MAWSQADVDAVKAALAKGERRVQFADRSVEYRSTDELLQILRAMEAELDAAASTPRPKLYYGHASKGF